MKADNKRRKSGRGCAWVILLLIIFLVLSAPLILRGIGAVLIYADPLEDADSVVALSGDTGDRVTEAAWLYEHQYADYLFITYTDEPARDALIRSAQLAGIPGERVIVTEMQVSNTVDEARAIKALAEERALELESELEQDEHPRDYAAELEDEDEEDEAAPKSDKRLKREALAEALKRTEESARTAADFQKVIAEWNRIDRNRERRERG